MMVAITIFTMIIFMITVLIMQVRKEPRSSVMIQQTLMISSALAITSTFTFTFTAPTASYGSPFTTSAADDLRA